MTIKTTLIAVGAAAFIFQVPSGLAQDASPAPSAATAPAATPTPASSPGGGGGGGGMAEFRQRIDDRLKTALKASDDEWAVIQPLLDKVEDAQRATMAGRFGGFGGFGRRGGGGGGGNGGPGGPGGGNGGPGGPSAEAGGSPANRPNRFGIASPEADALRDALASDGTPNDEIKTKLQALRDARKKASADLEQAREDLKKVLTLRQEATLVQMGLLD